MATTDQNITELPIKTASEVSDADYLMGIDLVEGYQVLTKDFADYVVNEAEITVGGKKQTTANAISEIGTTASNAQPKESGKGLSTNDFTNAYKTKLDGIATGAEVNVQSDWNASSGDAAILHKPTTLAGYGVKTEVDSLFDEKGLVDVVKGSDSVPYHFRRTPFGDRLKEKIIGGTVAWNQLFKPNKPTFVYNGVTFTNNNDGTFSVSGTATADGVTGLSYSIAFQQNHKYLLRANGASSTLQLSDGYGSDGYDTGNGKIINWNRASDDGYVYVKVINGTAYNTTITPQLFDLTQMFVSTIADYIYNIEQTTEGAGVALFRELFPKDYYEYDAGSLQSVSGLVSHDEVGFNQWDEEWEVGNIDSNGQPVARQTYFRSKNFIPVISGVTYYQQSGTSDYLYRYFYDTDKQYVGVVQNSKNAQFKVPSNAQYMKIVDVDRNTYNHDICINLSDPEKNGQYEPYKKHSYPLDSSLTLRGVPKLVDNKIKFDGDIYEPDGKVTRRYGEIILDGTQNILAHNFASGGYVQYRITAIGGEEGKQNSKYICDKYENYHSGKTYTESSISLYYESYLRILIRDSRFGSTITNADEWNAWLASNNVTFVYELATPTTEEAQPYTNPQRCAEGGTEEYVTTGIVPVGHESEYVSNNAERFDALPDTASLDGDYIVRQENGDMSLVSFDALLAPILGNLAIAETSPASASHAVGEYLLYNNRLYKVLAAISAGQQLTIGTNVGQTNVAAELASQANMISALNSKMSTPISIELAVSAQTYIDSLQGSYIRLGKIVVFSMKYTMKQAITSSLTVTNSLPRPIGFSPFLVTQVNTGSLDINKVFVVETNGSSQIRNPHPAEGTFAVSGVYISEYDT